MKKLIFLISFQLAVFSFQNSFGQWEQTSCPAGYFISCLDTSGTNLFAGTLDNNQSCGVLLSTDNGGSWAFMLSLTDDDVSSLAINGEYIFAGTGQGGVFLSTNNGANWTNVFSNMGVLSLAISGTNIYAGTSGVFLSTNDGGSWKAMNGLTDTLINSLAISGTNIFAGSNHSVFLSTNNGGNWALVLSIEGEILSLTINDGNIYAGSDLGVYLSTDNGGNWASINNGLQNGSIVSSFAVIGENIFAGTDGEGVFLSTNNGVSWKAVNNGLPDSTFIRSLAISGKYIYAGGGTYTGTVTGVWKSSLLDILGVNELGIKNEELGIKVYPNPVNELTVISFQLPVKGFVSLRIYDVMGREVCTLADGVKDEGEYSLNYDAEGLKSGVYFVRIVSDEGVGVAKFVKE